MQLKIKVDGVENLLARFEQFSATAQGDMMMAALKSGGGLIQESVRNSAPSTSGRQMQYRVKGNRLVRIPSSGNLKRSVKLSMSRRGRRGSGPQATIRVRAFYGKFVEYGTGRHLIRAGASNVLSFGGLFRKQVVHPGIRPNPFMRRGYDASEQAAIAEITRRLRNSIRYTMSTDQRKP